MENPQEIIRSTETRLKESEAHLEARGHTYSAHDIPRTENDELAERQYRPDQRVQVFYHRTDTLDLRISMLLAYVQKAKAHEQLGQQKEAHECYLRADSARKSIEHTLSYVSRRIKPGE